VLIAARDTRPASCLRRRRASRHSDETSVSSIGSPAAARPRRAAWDAAFTLLARGGFLVSSAQRSGEVPLVEIASPKGGTCRLVNPWPGAAVTLHRDGREAQELSGETLIFPTAKGETVVLVTKGSTPRAVRIN